MGNKIVASGEVEPPNLIGGYVLDYLRHRKNYTAKLENIIKALARDVKMDYDDVSGFVMEAIQDGISLRIITCDKNGRVKSKLDFSKAKK